VLGSGRMQHKVSSASQLPHSLHQLSCAAAAAHFLNMVAGVVTNLFISECRLIPAALTCKYVTVTTTRHPTCRSIGLSNAGAGGGDAFRSRYMVCISRHVDCSLSDGSSDIQERKNGQATENT
jgi:hypothetical protein